MREDRAVVEPPEAGRLVHSLVGPPGHRNVERPSSSVGYSSSARRSARIRPVSPQYETRPIRWCIKRTWCPPVTRCCARRPPRLPAAPVIKIVRNGLLQGVRPSCDHAPWPVQSEPGCERSSSGRRSKQRRSATKTAPIEAMTGFARFPLTLDPSACQCRAQPIDRIYRPAAQRTAFLTSRRKAG